MTDILQNYIHIRALNMINGNWKPPGRQQCLDEEKYFMNISAAVYIIHVFALLLV